MHHRVRASLLAVALMLLAGCATPATEPAPGAAAEPDATPAPEDHVPPAMPSGTTPPPQSTPDAAPGPGAGAGSAAPPGTEGLSVCPPPPEPIPPEGCVPPAGAPGQAPPPPGEPGAPPPEGAGPAQPPQGAQDPNAMRVTNVSSTYAVAPGGTSGSFRTGQDADLMLSGIGFDDTGGGLLFNHPMGIASADGKLLLADTRNNRVLVWTSLPTAGEAPDLVLGQPDLRANAPGRGLGGMNWPTSVATDGTRVVVTDAHNDRVLVWNEFPTSSGEPADFALASDGTGPERRGQISWPWSVWTDGTRLIVASTRASQVLVWNSFPTGASQAPDVVLANEDFGTPRSIGTDGNVLVIGDHNAKSGDMGNFFWRSFPTQDDAPYDFFMQDLPAPEGGAPPPGASNADVFYGPTIAPDGSFLVLTNRGLSAWTSFPADATTPPAFTLEPGAAGDGSAMAYADGRLWVSLYNANKVVVFDGVPASREAKPAFVLGAPDLGTNTLDENFVITNPVPVSDGASLVVSSDFDRKIYVWRDRPDESGAHPDLVYSFDDQLWDNALYGDKVVFAGRDVVYVWTLSTMLEGGEPDAVFRGGIGSARFQDLKGVALDAGRFYLADDQADRIHVWDALPVTGDEEPSFSLSIDGPTRLSSDGSILAVAATQANDGRVKLYRVDGLSAQSQPVVPQSGASWGFNLPAGVHVSGGRLFVGETSSHRVLVWDDAQRALAGATPDVVLGEADFEDTTAEIGRAKLFSPAALHFDGDYLWVGEFKFSGRLLRYSPS